MLTAQGDNDEIEKIFTNGGKLMTKELMSAAQRSAASAILDAPEGAWGRSATHMAAANGCVLGNTRLLPEESASTLQVLLRFGADVGLKDKAGLTPLHVATVYNCSKAAAVLLAAGADVNAATAERKLTALHMAANKDLLDVAAVLLTAKADPALQDARGHNAMQAAHLGTGRADNTAMKALLAKHGAAAPAGGYAHPSVARAVAEKDEFDTGGIAPREQQGEQHIWFPADMREKKKKGGGGGGILGALGFGDEL